MLEIVASWLLLTFMVVWLALKRNKTSADYFVSFAYCAFIIIPTVWIVLVRPSSPFYSVVLETMGPSLFLGIVFLVGYLLARRVILKSHVQPIALEFRNVAIPVAVLALVISVAAKVYLFHIGRFFIVETKDIATSAPIPAVIQVLQNVHILGYFVIATTFLRGSWRSRLLGPYGATFLIVFLYFITIEMLQGRRTGVVLPFAIGLLVLWFRGELLWKLSFISIAAALALFVGATLNRAASSESYETAISGDPLDKSLLVADLFFGRVGNPVIILTQIVDHVDRATYPFNPDSVVRLGSAFLPRAFLDKDPFAMTNEFARYLGLIPDFDPLTGINTGWIGEAYLYAGTLGVFGFGLLFGALASYLALLARHPNDVAVAVGIFIAIFCVNGFQMEIAFSVYTLIRAVAVFGLLGLLSRAANPLADFSCKPT